MATPERVVCSLLSKLKSALLEPPRADPHAGWCGEGELNTPPYPIRRVSHF